MTDARDAIRRTYDEYFKVFQTLRPEAVAPPSRMRFRR